MVTVGGGAVPSDDGELGRRMCRWQDSAGPYQTKIVMEWLDGVFGEKMLAIE